MWLSVCCAIVVVGLVNSLIYHFYIQMSHRDVRPQAEKSLGDFIHDAVASMFQNEPSPNFMNEKCSCSSGTILNQATVMFQSQFAELGSMTIYEYLVLYQPAPLTTTIVLRR